MLRGGGGFGFRGEAEDLAFEAAEAAANDADAGADAQGTGDEAYGALGVAEHEAELAELGGGYDGGGRGGVALLAAAVGQEAVDAGDADGAEAFLLGAVDEDGAGDDYAVYLGPFAVCPDAVVWLGGDVGFEALFTEPFGDGFFGVVAYQGDVPAGFGHTSGVANALGLCRYD